MDLGLDQIPPAARATITLIVAAANAAIETYADTPMRPAWPWLSIELPIQDLTSQAFGQRLQLLVKAELMSQGSRVFT